MPGHKVSESNRGHAEVGDTRRVGRELSRDLGDGQHLAPMPVKWVPVQSVALQVARRHRFSRNVYQPRLNGLPPRQSGNGKVGRVPVWSGITAQPRYTGSRDAGRTARRPAEGPRRTVPPERSSSWHSPARNTSWSRVGNRSQAPTGNSS